MAPFVAPRFSKRFRRLCQVAAVAGTARSQEVVDGLLPVAMVYDDGPWRGPEDWIRVVEELFTLTLHEGDVVSAVDRAIRANRFVYQGHLDRYVLSDESYRTTKERIESGEDLERRAQASWLADVEPLVAELGSDAIWTCLLSYSGKAFLAHGVEAAKLLSSDFYDDVDATENDSPESLLKAAMADSEIPEEHYSEVSSAISTFFDGKDRDRGKYVAELVEGTFNFLALGLDAETRKTVIESLPALSIFVDTNIIYNIIGAHDNPLAPPSVELFNIIRDERIPFKIYCHEKTLREVEETIGAIGDRLRRINWNSTISSAYLNSRINLSSIELKYHQINAETPTPVDVFLGKYANPLALLSELGIRINVYREASSAEQDRQRHELVAEFQHYRSSHGYHARPYRALDHDIAIWLAALARQTPGRKGPLFSGALIVSADHSFRRFDRELLSEMYGSGTWIVTRPDTLLQALRPFTASAKGSDTTFAKIFSMPEFRSIGRNHTKTVDVLAAYLATYKDLSEETATKLLTNSMLLNRLRDVPEESDEFRQVIEEHLVQENEILIQERNSLRGAQRKAALEAESIRRSLGDPSSERDPERRSRLMAQLENLLAELRDPAMVVNVERGDLYMSGDNYSGGYYENRASQIAAQGPGAQAHNTVQQSDEGRISVDLSSLAQELQALTPELVGRAETAADYQAVAAIQAAKEAATQKDERSVRENLAKAGRWALDAATSIGTTVAAAALRQAIGI